MKPIISLRACDRVVVGHRGDVAPAEDVIAVRRPVESAEQVQQRALAASRGAHDRHEIALGEVH
jgi:hypothetical protein